MRRLFLSVTLATAVAALFAPALCMAADQSYTCDTGSFTVSQTWSGKDQIDYSFELYGTLFASSAECSVNGQSPCAVFQKTEGNLLNFGTHIAGPEISILNSSLGDQKITVQVNNKAFGGTVVSFACTLD